MRKLLCLILALCLLCGCAANSAADAGEVFYRFTDDTGMLVSLKEPPKTVAVLLSSLADVWCTAGGSVDITVGETVERGFADSSCVLVDAGAGKTINIEQLVAAQPDFVLYSSDLAGQLACADTLREAGIAAAGFGVESFEDYLRVLKIATDILQTPENYDTYGMQVGAEIERLTSLANALSYSPKILFVRAGSSARVTKAKTADNHFVCAMLQELGAQNIADSVPTLLDGLSVEQVLIDAPVHILFTTMGEEDAAVLYLQSLLDDPVWSSLDAVRNGNIHQLPKDLFQYKPNARWAEAYAYLISLLYGDIV